MTIWTLAKGPKFNLYHLQEKSVIFKMAMLTPKSGINRNYLRVIMSMLVGKVGLTLIPKRFWIIWCHYIIRITKFWISLKLNYQSLLFLIFSNVILKLSSTCFAMKFIALYNDFTKFLSTWGLRLPRTTLGFLGAWTSKTVQMSFQNFCNVLDIPQVIF